MYLRIWLRPIWMLEEGTLHGRCDTCTVTPAVLARVRLGDWAAWICGACQHSLRRTHGLPAVADAPLWRR